MILGFKTSWPNGQPTYFPEKIMAGLHPGAAADYISKIHDFRKGARWKAGMIIQFATGVRTKHQDVFAEGVCRAEQPTSIGIHRDNSLYILIFKTPEDFRPLSPGELLLYAANDGFNSVEEMRQWFFPDGYGDGPNSLIGQTVHWTEFKY